MTVYYMRLYVYQMIQIKISGLAAKWLMKLIMFLFCFVMNPYNHHIEYTAIYVFLLS